MSVTGIDVLLDVCEGVPRLVVGPVSDGAGQVPHHQAALEDSGLACVQSILDFFAFPREDGAVADFMEVLCRERSASGLGPCVEPTSSWSQRSGVARPWSVDLARALITFGCPNRLHFRGNAPAVFADADEEARIISLIEHPEEHSLVFAPRCVALLAGGTLEATGP